MTQERTNQQICPKCGEDYGEGLEFCPADGTRLRSFTIRHSTEEEDPLLGSDIDGRFSVERVLGVGGMGKVYSGKQLSVNREVAIKVLRSELANDEKIVKRFFREAQVISQFSHPNIVSLVDFGQDVENDILYLAMEFIDGTELADLVSRHRFVPAFAVELMIQVCEALSEPHELGVIHRDLKPENIMLLPRSDGRVQAKVVDFGIAHAIQNQTKLTQTGSVFGTAHYMAPEQAQGHEVGAGTDIYALGCILFELLTGAVPFDGETAMQLLMAHVQGDPPILAHFLPGGPETDELSELVLQMMRKTPEERPASVLEVRDWLEKIQRKYSHPRVKIDLSAQGDGMYARWLAESIDVRAAAGTMERQTNAPVSAHSTEENLGIALGDTMAQGPQTGPAAMATAQAQVAPIQGVTRSGQAADTTTEPAHVTGLTDLVVPAKKKKLIPLLALLFLALVVVALGLAVVFSGGDDEVIGGDALAATEPGEAEAVVVGAEEPAEEELGEEAAARDEKPAQEEIAEETEFAAEEEDEQEEEDEKEEGEEVAEQAPDEEAEPEPEPEPAAAPPPRQVRQEPAPRPRQPRRPAAEPEVEEEPEQRRRMNIFTVD